MKMGSWPSVVNDRDIEASVVSHKTDNLSLLKREAMMIFYSGVEEVKNIEDIIKNGCKIIVLMRGLPGSGKSTLVRYLMERTTDASATKEKHVFSADDYFIDPESSAYVFNREFLQEAHSWNVEGVLAAAQTNVTPIIVDNTNLTVSEMWPYACIAAKYDYIVRYLEPSTHWRYNVHECAKRNLHGVSEQHIATMMGRFDRSVSESELLSLVSSKTNFQSCRDSRSNSKITITRYSQIEHYAENHRRTQFHSACTCDNKTSKLSCIHLDSCSPNIPKMLLDPANILRALRTSGNPETHKFILTYLPTNLAFMEIVFSAGILSVQTTYNLRKQHQTCKSISLRNNMLPLYDEILKFLSFLHLLVSVRNVGVYAAQFISLSEIHNRLCVQRYSPLAADDSLVGHRCMSRGKLMTILTIEHGVQPSVNINNVKKVVFPTNITYSYFSAQKAICDNKWTFEMDNRKKKNEVSNVFPTENTTIFPSVAKVCNVEERSTVQTSTPDTENTKSSRYSWDVCDSENGDAWNVCDIDNYESWDVSGSGGSNSWDVCDNVSWEPRTPNESDCVLPKPPRNDRKVRTLRYCGAQKPLRIMQRNTLSTSEVETNCSFPKPQRANRKPRTMQYSREEYTSKLEPKALILQPELEAWNAVEDPLSSWERKQNIGSGNETASRRSHKSQNTSLASEKIKVRSNEVSPASAEEEENQLISKPQREKRIRNRQ